MGLHLDPWQKLVVRVALADDDRGLYAAREVAYLVSRQNGKGGALEAVALHGLFLVGDPLTLWTAHQFKTSSEAFLRMKGWIEGSADLSRHVRRVSTSHGEEGFELHSGARLRFLARSKSSGRGFSPQRIIFDEAQELAKVAAEAMLPSMRAQRNRQAIYTGTVPGPDINNPEHWRRLRDRGRSGDAGRLAWLEWTPKGSDDPETAAGLDLDSRAAWRASNPGLGYRDGLGIESLADDREALDDDSFGRECLSIWPTEAEVDMDGAFGPGAWTSCATAEAPPNGGVTLGLAVSIDRAYASIGAAAELGDQVHIGPVRRDRGTAWVVGELVKLDRPVVVDGRGPAADLIPDLEAEGVEVLTASTGDVLDACAGLFDAVQERRVVHGAYPELNDAVSGAQKRLVGDRWAWGRKLSTADVSMLEAVTLAVWGVEQDADYDLLASIA